MARHVSCRGEDRTGHAVTYRGEGRTELASHVSRRESRLGQSRIAERRGRNWPVTYRGERRTEQASHVSRREEDGTGQSRIAERSKRG